MPRSPTRIPRGAGSQWGVNPSTLESIRPYVRASQNRRSPASSIALAAARAPGRFTWREPGTDVPSRSTCIDTVRGGIPDSELLAGTPTAPRSTARACFGWTSRARPKPRFSKSALRRMRRLRRLAALSAAAGARTQSQGRQGRWPSSRSQRGGQVGGAARLRMSNSAHGW